MGCSSSQCPVSRKRKDLGQEEEVASGGEEGTQGLGSKHGGQVGRFWRHRWKFWECRGELGKVRTYRRL